MAHEPSQTEYNQEEKTVMTSDEYEELLKHVLCGALAYIPIDELEAAKSVKAMDDLVNSYYGEATEWNLAQRHFPDEDGDYFYDCHACIICCPDEIFLSEHGECPGGCRDGYPTEEAIENQIWHCDDCLEQAKEKEKSGGICAYCHQVLVNGECVTESYLVNF